MSSERRTTTESEQTETCAYCTESVSEKRLTIQSYPETDRAAIEGLNERGLTLCESCATEPVALIENWTGHDQPPIERNQPVGAGYREVAHDCSFCADTVESQPVLGVELYRRPGERLPAYANYTLCGDCQEIFEAFLENIRNES